MKKIALFLSLFTFPAFADGTVMSGSVASVVYVQNKLATKVDTSATAKQTLAGEYNIVGTLRVSTPPYPTVVQTE